MNNLNLIISCGGSGLTTLTTLNKLLAQNPDILPYMSKDIYYLAVDTDEEALNTFEKDIKLQMKGFKEPFIQKIYLSEKVTILNDIVKPHFVDPFKVSKNGKERLVENWWHDQKEKPFNAPRVVPLCDGAGQCPPASYGLAWYRLRDIGKAVKKIVDKMMTNSRGDAERIRNIRVIVVSGLSGGTGRGCWSLITFKVREYLLDQYNVKIPPVGIFFDANVFDSVAERYPGQRIPLKVNSLTGISELSCWMQNGNPTGDDQFEYRLPDMKSPRRRDTDVLKVNLEINPQAGAPFQKAYLICGRNKSAVLKSNEQYHEMAGAAIYAMITNSEITSRVINEGAPFNSIAACTFDIDVQHIRSYFEARARGIAINRLVTNTEEVSDEVNDFLLKHPFDEIVENINDLQPKGDGTFYQRVINEILTNDYYVTSFETIKAGLSKWNYIKAKKSILPLLSIKEEIISSAVKKVLKDLRMDQSSGKSELVLAMKKVYRGDEKKKQKPSVSRAEDFLLKFKSNISTAWKESAKLLTISNKTPDDNYSVKNDVDNILKIYSKRSITEVIKNVGKFNKDEIAKLMGGEENWGIIQKGVAAFLYPKIKSTFEYECKPILETVDSITLSFAKFKELCLEIQSKLNNKHVLSEAAGCASNEDAFEHLFATPATIDKTLYDSDKLERLYHRVLVPIYEDKNDLEESVKDSIYMREGIGTFISQVVDDGTLEELFDDERKQEKFKQDLYNIICDNVSLSDDFMLNHFNFEKILEQNCKYWNAAIAAVQGNSADKATLYSKFYETLGVTIENPFLPPVRDLCKTIAASLANSCVPWWNADDSFCNEAVAFVPFKLDKIQLNSSDVETYIENEVERKFEVKDLSTSRGGANPFSYVVYATEGIKLEDTEKEAKKHLLDKVKSLNYYDDPDVNAWLQKAEKSDGESIFSTDDDNKGIGYLSPLFIKNEKLLSYRWKPWLKENETEEAMVKNQALDIILYSLLGVGLTPEQIHLFKEKYNQWFFPVIKIEENGQACLLVRKTLKWNNGIAVPNQEECTWKVNKRLCTSVSNLLTLLEGKGKTGKNGALKLADVQEGNKLKDLLFKEISVFNEYVLPKLGSDLTKLVEARTNWLSTMCDDADEKDKEVFEMLLKRSAK